MKVRTYGAQPRNVVLVHGGPGAPGGMRPVAEQLSSDFGVIEPLQTANTVQGQIDELKRAIEEFAGTPVVLAGWSWGAWLSYLLAAQEPQLVRKLILISSGPFEPDYADGIMTTRLSRMSEKERQRVEEIMSMLQRGGASRSVFEEFGAIIDRADSYRPIVNEDADDLDTSEFGPDIYERVWPEADAMRRSGRLIEAGRKIVCPVTAIHGDYDPHPAAGVSAPLSKVLRDFKFVLLAHCGHHPWYEQEAMEEFYLLLRQELQHPPHRS